MDDDRAADDAFVSVKSDFLVLEVDVSDSGTVGLDVAEITSVTMSRAILGRPVFSSVGIEVRPG